MKVYIVQGNSGEYSDRVDWLVKAFISESKAIEFRDFLESKLKERGLHAHSDAAIHSLKERTKKSIPMTQYDPDFYGDYTGTYYCILSVDLEN